MSGSRDAEYTEYVAARLSSLRRLAAVLCDDWQRADDLVQAALVKLYVHWGQVRAASHTDAYARAVLVHEFIHERRSTWVKRVRLSGELKCTAPEDNTTRLTGRAPSLRGHRAFWAGTWDTPSLAWQYARNGWAEMALPFYPNNPAKQAAARSDAVKIASQIRYGATTPPLLFPIQLTHLPSRWRVSSVTYVPDAGVLRASSYALGAGPPNLGADGGLVYETGLPYFDVNPPSFYGNPPCYRGERGSKIINGYQVVVTNVIKEQLCAPRARGLIVIISEFGAQPAISVNSLFGHHLRLLGPNPANWTSKPIG